MFYWIGYKGLYQFRIVKDREMISEIIRSKNELKSFSGSNRKSNNNTFSESNPTYEKLELFMVENKSYRDPSISLDSIAEKLDISSGYLSQVINKVSHKNFSEYINSYRIEEVKTMLLDSEFDKYSILSIGYEAGFNSKSVFYTVFKKQTGLTPKQFKDKNKVHI